MVLSAKPSFRSLWTKRTAGAESPPQGSPQSSRPRKTNRRHGHRRGVAAVEFALVAPLFFLVLMGMLEFGRMLMVQQVLTNASREGARRAAIEGAIPTEVESRVNEYLATTSVTGATIVVSPENLSTVGFGDSVSVTVSVPFNTISWTGSAWFLGDKTLTASTTMRGERIQ